MTRFLLAAALVVPAAMLVGPAQAEDKKPAGKSDVVVKLGDTTAKAKVGQTIELQLPNTPPPAAKDIDVKVDGAAIAADPVKRVILEKVDGKPVAGKGTACVVLTAKAAGTAKVTVDYTTGDKKETRVYEITVAD